MNSFVCLFQKQSLNSCILNQQENRKQSHTFPPARDTNAYILWYVSPSVLLKINQQAQLDTIFPSFSPSAGSTTLSRNIGRHFAQGYMFLLFRLEIWLRCSFWNHNHFARCPLHHLCALGLIGRITVCPACAGRPRLCLFSGVKSDTGTGGDEPMGDARLVEVWLVREQRLVSLERGVGPSGK